MKLPFPVIAPKIIHEKDKLNNTLPNVIKRDENIMLIDLSKVPLRHNKIIARAKVHRHLTVFLPSVKLSPNVTRSHPIYTPT